MTSSQHGSYALGYTHATMACTEGCEGATWSESRQSRPQFRLESATRLHEGGVASTAGQHTAVNTFPGLVHTAPHVMKAGKT